MGTEAKLCYASLFKDKWTLDLQLSCSVFRELLRTACFKKAPKVIKQHKNTLLPHKHFLSFQEPKVQGGGGRNFIKAQKYDTWFVKMLDEAGEGE